MFALILLLGSGSLHADAEISVDVCVYGGTSGGVVAAVQAARMGKKVALVCDKNHLGGMTSSGLGWTDVGHVGTSYIQGLANEFYNRVNAKYGSDVGYHFEPHVAEAVFNEMAQQSGVLLFTNQYLVSVVKLGPKILAAKTSNGNIFRAAMFIDASYTGDLMATAGVDYTIGRESAAQYGESLAGVRPPDTSFGSAVSPYVVSGSPASGLLPLIQTNQLAVLGSADPLVQTYNFRMCFTQTVSNRLAITAPASYDPAQYELLARYLQANPSLSLSALMTLGTPLPNGKMDINNSGPISTDFVGESAEYAAADPVRRAQIWQDHKNYEQGFFYFLATDSRVPSGIKSTMQSWGMCKDEFTDNGGWPWELYVREARRMVSDYVLIQSNVFNQLTVSDSIGMAGYFTDSHYCERIVTNGVVVNEGTARGDITVPYPVAYRALVPKPGECVNLLVPWCASASHIAFCSLRMEPAFMIMAQAAGTAACFAMDDQVSVQNVNIAKLQSQLVADGQALQASNGSGNSGVTNHAVSLLLDFGPTAVASAADRLNDPAHGAYGLSSVQNHWNTAAALSGSPLIYSDGTSAAGIAYALGRSGAGGVGADGLATNVSFSNPNINNTTLTGAAAYISGVYAGNSPMKDGVFAIGTAGVSTNALGLRVDGLAAGTYTLYVSARNSNLSGSQTERIYYTNGPAAAAYNFLNSPSAFQTNLYSGSPTTTFALGDDYNVVTLNLNAGDSLYLACIGYTNSATAERRGFLNLVEIVPGLPPAPIPEVNLWATDAQASRYGPSSGSFTVSRSDSGVAPLTIYFKISGTASNGVDFAYLGGSVLLPTGITDTNLLVTPYGAKPVGGKTLTITLATNSAYSVGSLSTATININDTPINGWRAQYFGTNAANQAIAGDAAAPAGDGVPNLIKYALGLNPTNFNHGLQMTPLIGADGGFEVSYTRPDPAPLDINYIFGTSTNLVTWTTNSGMFAKQIIINLDNTATVTSESPVPVSALPRQFLRFGVIGQ